MIPRVITNQQLEQKLQEAKLPKKVKTVLKSEEVVKDTSSRTFSVNPISLITEKN